MNLQTLQPKHCILNNIELYEPIDYDKLNLLLQSNLLKQYTGDDGKIYDSEKTHLEKYRKNYVKRIKAVKVKYTRGELMEYGRVNPEFSLGLHCLKKATRHTLVANNLVDIDIVNAHPIILLNICRQYDYPCEKLQYYTKHREEILKTICDTHSVARDTAKNLMIILTYLGSYNKWITDNNITGEPVPFLVDYHREMNILGTIIKNCNPDLVERLAAIKDKRKVNSIMSYYLQTIECYILEEIFLYCRRRRIVNKTCVLSNDGIMIPTDKYTDDLIEQFENVVRTTFNISLNFERKAMDKGYTADQMVNSIRDEKIIFMGKTFNKIEMETGVLNELEAFEKVMSVFDDFKYIKGHIYGFDFDTGMWADGELVFKKIVSNMDDYLHIRVWKKDTEEYVNSNSTYNNKVGKMRDLVSYFKDRVSFLPQFLDDTFFERNRHTSRGCLLFSNGILKTNWETKKLDFINGFDRDMVFTSRINVEFTYYKDDTALCSADDIKEVKKVFFDIFGNQQDVFIEFIAAAIFGLTLKKVGYVIGDTNAGKSTLVGFIKKAFSSEVVGDFDNKSFIDNKYAVTDASQNRWALLVRDKKLLISSESVLRKLNTETIKHFSSGGEDEIVGRLHRGDETSFMPSFMMLTMLNTMPSFTKVDDALRDRLLILKLKKSYKAVVKNPDTDALRYTREELNKYNNERFLDAFRWVIIKAYCKFMKRGMCFDMDEELTRYLNEVMEENLDDGSQDVMDKVFELFTFTGLDEDRVSNSAMIEVMEKHNCLKKYSSVTSRFRKELLDTCAKSVGVVVKCQRYIDGDTQIRGYIGIKLNNQDDGVSGV